MSHLAALIDRLPSARVLVVGDLMLDRYVYGSVERISPEAPIPVFRVQRMIESLGGAGNVAANLAALGAGQVLAGVIGEDDGGRAFSTLAANRLGAAALVADDSRPTTLKTRHVAAGQQMLRADQESTAPLSPALEQRLLDAVTAALAGCGVVILSDYGKGVLTDGVITGIITAANAAGKPVIVDPKGRDYTRYRGAALITPNRKELAAATGLPVAGDAAVVAAARFLLEQGDFGAVIATRSEEGMTLVTRAGDIAHLPAEAREVFDVSGAGDTVIATLAAALATGADLADAARLANLAGGVVVGKVGTATVTGPELAAALHRQSWSEGLSKFVTLPEALERVARWRKAGQPVGFTNGCFDLIHPGHVSLLSQARAACRHLIVGLNSDASVKRLKGPSRPVQGENARAAVLAAMAAVDLVVLFDEDTPIELIRAIAPDVLVKGADYTVETVVGADLVLANGGRILLADLTEGQSTTRMIGRMAG